MAIAKITRTKIIDGKLYSKGGTYEVDKATHALLKNAGALAKQPEPATTDVSEETAHDDRTE